MTEVSRPSRAQKSSPVPVTPRAASPDAVPVPTAVATKKVRAVKGGGATAPSATAAPKPAGKVSKKGAPTTPAGGVESTGTAPAPAPVVRKARGEKVPGPKRAASAGAARPPRGAGRSGAGSASGAVPVVRKIAAVPMSPRTATRKLANPDPMSYKDVRETTNSVAKTVSRIAQLAYEVGKNGEVTTPDGGRYTRSDVTELTSRTVQAIYGIPKAARRSSRRNNPTLTVEEKSVRVKALVGKAEAGIESLNVFLKNKAATKLLLENEIARIRTIRVPPKADAGDQISAAFYISDPLQKFFENANLGNGIALFYPGLCSDATKAISGATNPAAAIEAVAKETGRNPVADLGGKRDVVEQLADPRRVISPLVIERSIATSPLLMALMALYILANNLKTADGRIRIDSQMQKFFGAGTKTRWVVGGQDLTQQAQDSGAIPADDPSRTDGELSGLERLLARPPKNAGDPVPCDGKTFTRAMSITLASYYRVRWITPEMAADLAKDSVKNLAYGVKAYL